MQRPFSAIRRQDLAADHFAMIDWAGFRVLTDALGGVTVKVPVTTSDPVAG